MTIISIKYNVELAYIFYIIYEINLVLEKQGQFIILYVTSFNINLMLLPHVNFKIKRNENTYSRFYTNL